MVVIMTICQLCLFSNFIEKRKFSREKWIIEVQSNVTKTTEYKQEKEQILVFPGCSLSGLFLF